VKRSSFAALWLILVAVWALGMATTSFFASGKIILDRIFWTGLALVPLAQAAVLQSVGRILRKKGDERG
jgi:uncharacterized membrane protein